MIKRILFAFVALITVVSLISCRKEEKIFGHAELRLPLSSDFQEFRAESFDVAYTNGTLVVGAFRVSFDAGAELGIPDFLTAEQFARLYLSETGREAEIKKHGLMPYYEYTEIQDGLQNSYLASFFRSKYAYFIVVFACPSAVYSENLPLFLSYTDSVIFVY